MWVMGQTEKERKPSGRVYTIGAMPGCSQEASAQKDQSFSPPLETPVNTSEESPPRGKFP